MMPDVSVLVHQMHDTLSRIHATIAALDTDTKSHESQLDALEAKRVNLIEQLQAAFRAQSEALGRRRKAARDALAGQRRREDEQIAARRTRQDAELQDRDQSEDQEREKNLADEKKVVEEETDSRMDEVELEAQRMLDEGHKKLSELERQRRELNSIIDEHMKAPLPSPPKRRRGTRPAHAQDAPTASAATLQPGQQNGSRESAPVDAVTAAEPKRDAGEAGTERTWVQRREEEAKPDSSSMERTLPKEVGIQDAESQTGSTGPQPASEEKTTTGTHHQLDRRGEPSHESTWDMADANVDVVPTARDRELDGSSDTGNPSELPSASESSEAAHPKEESTKINNARAESRPVDQQTEGSREVTHDSAECRPESPAQSSANAYPASGDDGDQATGGATPGSMIPPRSRSAKDLSLVPDQTEEHTQDEHSSSQRDHASKGIIEGGTAEAYLRMADAKPESPVEPQGGSESLDGGEHHSHTRDVTQSSGEGLVVHPSDRSESRDMTGPDVAKESGDQGAAHSDVDEPELQSHDDEMESSGQSDSRDVANAEAIKQNFDDESATCSSAGQPGQWSHHAPFPSAGRAEEAHEWDSHDVFNPAAVKESADQTHDADLDLDSHGAQATHGEPSSDMHTETTPAGELRDDGPAASKLEARASGPSNSHDAGVYAQLSSGFTPGHDDNGGISRDAEEAARSITQTCTDSEDLSTLNLSRLKGYSQPAIGQGAPSESHEDELSRSGHDEPRAQQEDVGGVLDGAGNDLPLIRRSDANDDVHERGLDSEATVGNGSGAALERAGSGVIGDHDDHVEESHHHWAQSHVEATAEPTSEMQQDHGRDNRDDLDRTESTKQPGSCRSTSQDQVPASAQGREHAEERHGTNAFAAVDARSDVELPFQSAEVAQTQESPLERNISEESGAHEAPIIVVSDEEGSVHGDLQDQASKKREGQPVPSGRDLARAEDDAEFDAVGAGGSEFGLGHSHSSPTTAAPRPRTLITDNFHAAADDDPDEGLFAVLPTPREPVDQAQPAQLAPYGSASETRQLPTAHPDVLPSHVSNSYAGHGSESSNYSEDGDEDLEGPSLSRDEHSAISPEATLSHAEADGSLSGPEDDDDDGAHGAGKFEHALGNLPDESAHTVQGTDDLFGVDSFSSSSDSSDGEEEDSLGEAVTEHPERVVYQADATEDNVALGDPFSSPSVARNSGSWGHGSSGCHSSIVSVRETTPLEPMEGSDLATSASVARADWTGVHEDEWTAPFQATPQLPPATAHDTPGISPFALHNTPLGGGASDEDSRSLDASRWSPRAAGRPRTPSSSATRQAAGSPVTPSSAVRRSPSNPFRSQQSPQQFGEPGTDPDMFRPRDVTNTPWHVRNASTPASTHSQTTLSSHQSSPIHSSLPVDRHEPVIRDSWPAPAPGYQQYLSSLAGRPREDSLVSSHNGDYDAFNADTAGGYGTGTKSDLYNPLQQRSRAESSASASTSAVAPARGSGVFHKMRSVFEPVGARTGEAPAHPRPVSGAYARVGGQEGPAQPTDHAGAQARPPQGFRGPLQD